MSHNNIPLLKPFNMHFYDQTFSFVKYLRNSISGLSTHSGSFCSADSSFEVFWAEFNPNKVKKNKTTLKLRILLNWTIITGVFNNDFSVQTTLTDFFDWELVVRLLDLLFTLLGCNNSHAVKRVIDKYNCYEICEKQLIKFSIANLELSELSMDFSELLWNENWYEWEIMKMYFKVCFRFLWV